MIEINLENITKVYRSGAQPVAAVNNISLTINAGELFFLLGPSGCGKTTLLRMIAGLILPTSGRILFDNREVTNLPTERRNTALVFQNYALWPHMTAQQNVEFGPRMSKRPTEDCRRLAQESLHRVEMGEYALRKPNQLSGGQQQRVALARALAAEPEVLLLDEPLSNLDAQLRLHMRDELRSLVKALGTTAVYVTHDQKEALSMADRVAVVNKGVIVQVGTPEELYHRPKDRFIAEFLGEANLISGSVTCANAVAEVETAAGTLRGPNELELMTQSRVTCCVRPESIRIGSPDQASPQTSCIPAQVVKSVYLGEIRQYTCRLQNGDEWKVSTLSEPRPVAQPGDDINLLIDPEQVALIRE